MFINLIGQGSEFARVLIDFEIWRGLGEDLSLDISSIRHKLDLHLDTLTRSSRSSNGEIKESHQS